MTSRSKTQAYSFRQRGNQSEWHVFEGRFLDSGGCDTVPQSVCGRLADNFYTDNWVTGATCLNADEARSAAAMLGKGVCYECLGKLYRHFGILK